MDRNVRYHRLSSEEEESNSAPNSTATPVADTEDMEDTSASTIAAAVLEVDDVQTAPQVFLAAGTVVQIAAMAPPPPYAATSDEASSATASASPSTVVAPKYNGNLLPSYMIATELPTYDEVQQLKLEEQQQEPIMDPDMMERGDALLGTDFMFLSAFFVAFLFNWIGFLMLMCFCPTIAGRYGALAGFGLSLAKWTLIVKHSTDLIKTENNWLWWLILAFGVLICVRAVLQYLHVKREWGLLTRATQERLMYFY